LTGIKYFYTIPAKIAFLFLREEHIFPARDKSRRIQMKQQALKSPSVKKRPAFECIALVLQGGGALGSYQGGIYEGLAEADLHPDWVAGISIGAFNAAIIAGNAPEDRVAKLRGFWNTITANPLLDIVTLSENLEPKGDLARPFYNEVSANLALLSGAPGFFSPRTLPPFFQPNGTKPATSFYESAQLKTTLERFIDFDRLNKGEMRFSIGAVNVRSGNFIYFDNRTHVIRPEHVMASGSLPPGFAPTEIDGEFYWDGGLISNTPLQWVLGPNKTGQDTLVFQVDLWPAQGNLPKNLSEVAMRQKEIQFSSRTRAGTEEFKRRQRLRASLANVLAKLPAELQDSKDVAMLKEVAGHEVYNIVHLIYRTRKYESHSKDYEFSRLSMQEHWRSGYQDAVCTLSNPEIFERPQNSEGVGIFDMLKD